MKNILTTLIIIIITITSCKAQQIVDASTFNDGNNEAKYFKDLNNNFAPFLGTWEWQNGNQIFRVTLWKEEQVENENGNRPSFYWDQIKGHYEMVQLGQSGQQLETVIYTSQKKIGQSTSDWFPVISGRGVDGMNFDGTVYDNSVVYNPKYITGVRGILKLDIIPSTIPSQMEWKVTLPQGMYGTDQPTEFNIPTDIILTKQ
ncbi:hypothetical protein ES677_14485 [Bizionia gelidisalsuginis]|uniref:DUF6705 domain-containing protein n=2 Tax=Bizionia TaxID=283785 RepID=A0A8H2LCJ0_9FLAO|nr:MULTISPECIES: DUF6705 family protein [Bizionia]TYB69017.1 hypothetical protein ES676_14525 [Bizionia saleffrena]TYC08412.1 hypothetical protein ES677_14485 [Bizionia gelidisalsuginis]